MREYAIITENYNISENNHISEEEKQQILEQLTKTEPDDLNNTLEIEE